MSSKRASVNPLGQLALFLKPQSLAERLAAQQRDRKKLQRERQRQGARLGRGLWGARAAPRTSLHLSQSLQGQALSWCEPLASLSLLLSTVQPQPQPQPQTACTGGSRTQTLIPDRTFPEVPSNSKINPQTPSRTEIEIYIMFYSVVPKWSWIYGEYMWFRPTLYLCLLVTICVRAA